MGAEKTETLATEIIQGDPKISPKELGNELSISTDKAAELIEDQGQIIQDAILASETIHNEPVEDL